MFPVFFLTQSMHLLHQTTGKTTLKEHTNLFWFNMLTKRIMIFSCWSGWFMVL